MKTYLTPITVAITGLLSFYGCSSEQVESDLEAVEDIQSMQAREDGNYDVLCDSGVREIVTPQQIADDDVCEIVPALPDNIFSMQRRQDGKFDVVCKNESREVAGANEIRSGSACAEHSPDQLEAPLTCKTKQANDANWSTKIVTMSYVSDEDSIVIKSLRILHHFGYRPFAFYQITEAWLIERIGNRAIGLDGDIITNPENSNYVAEYYTTLAGKKIISLWALRLVPGAISLHLKCTVAL